MAFSRIQPGRFLLPSLRLLCLPHASQEDRVLGHLDDPFGDEDLGV